MGSALWRRRLVCSPDPEGVTPVAVDGGEHIALLEEAPATLRGGVPPAGHRRPLSCCDSVWSSVRPIRAGVAAVDILEFIGNGFDKIPVAILQVEGRTGDHRRSHLHQIGLNV
ncbi:hypothetical protein G6F31_013361 [Rhizopus arrhizus]|nr:hypothetical protein G6F31_013361 [Rhizopus arrhizus]